MSTHHDYNYCMAGKFIRNCSCVIAIYKLGTCNCKVEYLPLILWEAQHSIGSYYFCAKLLRGSTYGQNSVIFARQIKFDNGM